MRLSDVRGARTIDLIADVIGPITSIAADEEAMELFSPKEVPDGMTSRQYFLSRVGRAAPALLRGHRDEVVEILAAIEGETPEQYLDGLSLPKLLGDMVSLMTDEALLDFLAPSDSAPGSSGGASEPTVGQPEQTPSRAS